jgi:hypothetical protein
MVVRTRRTTVAPTTLVPQQLALPLSLPDDPIPAPADTWLLPPQAVWASLSSTQQTHVSQTVHRIAAQVVRDADRA